MVGKWWVAGWRGDGRGGDCCGGAGLRFLGGAGLGRGRGAVDSDTAAASLLKQGWLPEFGADAV